METPAKFPDGCKFGMDLTDDDGVELSYVRFPDGEVFMLDEKSPWKGLLPAGNYWPRRWTDITEEDFLRTARDAL